MFLLINDSPEPWQGSVELGSSDRTGDVLHPRTGDLLPLAATADVALALAGWGATVVRLNGVHPVARLSVNAARMTRVLTGSTAETHTGEAP